MGTLSDAEGLLVENQEGSAALGHTVQTHWWLFLLGMVETRVWGAESKSHTRAALRRWLCCLLPNMGLSEPPTRG